MSRFQSIALLAIAVFLFTADNLFAQIFPAQSYRQQGARRGAVAGAVIGGLVGGRSDRPALGVVVGGATGAIVGQAIGQRKDQRVYQQQYYGHSGYYPQQPFQGNQHWHQPQFNQQFQPQHPSFSPFPQPLQPQPFIPQQQFYPQQHQPHQHLPQQPYYQQPATPFYQQSSQSEGLVPSDAFELGNLQIATPVPVSPPNEGVRASSSRLGLPPLPEIPSVAEPNSARLNSPGPRPYSHGG